MKKFYFYIFFLCWLSFLKATSIQSFDKVNFTQLSVGDGLSQSTVLCIYQDSFGFIWIGTRDGMNMWDGYEFKVFRNNPKDSTSIKSNYINTIVEDENSNLWIGTKYGLSFYNRNYDTFQNKWFDSTDCRNCDIRSILVEKNGNVWVGSKKGLFILNPGKKTFEKPNHTFLNSHGIIDKSIFTLFHDANNNLWVGRLSDGIYKINFFSEQVIQYSVAFSKAPGYKPTTSRVQTITQDLKGNIWIGTYGEGVSRIDLQGTIKHFLHEPGDIISLSNNYVRDLIVDRNDNLWIGTFDGLNIYNAEHDNFTRITYDETNPKGLAHSSIRSLFQDKKGAVWIGTYFGGINIYDKDNQKFKHYKRNVNDEESLSYDVVSAFAEDESGNIWIGTERGGLNFFDAKTKIFQHFKTEKGNDESLSSNTIKSLLLDKDNCLWIGTFKAGLNAFDIEKKLFIRYPSANNKNFDFLHEANINCIYEDKKGFLWIVTDKCGIQKFDKTKREFIEYYHSDTLNAILERNPARSIMQDNMEYFWLSTEGKGIITFHEADKTLFNFLHDNNDTLSLSNNYVNFIYQDNKGIVWVATNGGGFNRFNRRSGTFTLFNTENGIISNNYLGVTQDDKGYLWLAVMNGILRINPEDNTFKIFDHRGGFPLKELNEGAFFRKKNGDILFGGVNGFVQINPKSIKDNDYVPPIVITDFKLFNKSVRPGDNSGILKKNIINTKQITLKHYQSVFTLEYSALSYYKSKNNQYAYILEGFHPQDGSSEQWSFVGKKRSVTYTNLKEGDYVFKVKGANNDGIWNDQYTELNIKILPPPWRTWWAFLLYILIICFALFYFWKNAMKSANLKHDLKIKELEKEKLHELHQLKLEFFTNVSHEFRTPLTLIVNPLEEILSTIEADNWLKNKLKIIQYNCRRLLLLIRQVMEIREFETGNLIMDYSSENINNVIGCVVESFKGLADKRNTKIDFDYENREVHLDFDKDKIETVFYNLLSNAFKFTKEGDAVKVSMRILDKPVIDDNEGYVEFIVSDNGIGIAKEHIGNIFTRFYKFGDNSGSGIGLAHSKSLIEMHNGNIRVESESGLGTRFIIRLPLGKTGSFKTNETFVKPLPIEYQVYGNHLIYNDDEVERMKVKPSVLLIDDDSDLRSYLEQYLSPTYDILLAENGNEGLSITRKTNPDLIVSDIMMPQMDGHELCKRIKNDIETCHIPVVLLTAKASDLNRIQGLESGADAYINKPFILNELESTIKNLLENRSIMREKYQKQITLKPKDIILNSRDEKLLEKIVQVIEKNISEPTLNVEFLGKEIGLSRVHLYRKVKALTDLAPVDFIRKFRLQRAAQLLSQKKLYVNEIAYEVGFQDINYFGKCFRKEFGLAPSEYAEQFKIKN